MAQLTDDCFAFNGPLLPVAEAEQLIAARVNPVSGCESVPLREALGRVLAADIIAPVNLPPFDNSAVDGFAVRHQDVAGAGETRLIVVDRVQAGAADRVGHLVVILQEAHERSGRQAPGGGAAPIAAVLAAGSR